MAFMRPVAATATRVDREACLLPRLGLENHALAVLTVHHHGERCVEVQQAYATELFEALLCSQPLPIDKAFAGIGVHREVSDLECRQILKEVAPLRRRHPKIAES